MSAFIVVTDSAWTAQTNGQGVAAFGDAPAVPTRVTVFHPYLKAPANLVEHNLPANQRNVNVSVRLRPSSPMTMSDY
jgi:hypothetical protein